MSEPSGRTVTYAHCIIWALVLAGLFLTSRYSLLLFHNITGLFSVVIAEGVFVAAWNARGFLENNYLLFLGIAFLFVGALNLLHTLSYPGMMIFPGFDAGLPTQLGAAARGLESMSWCLAPLCLGRRLRPVAVFAGYLAAFAAIILAVFVWRPFPAGMAAGPGLMALKQTGDCLTGVILLGAMAMLWRRREEFDPRVLHLLLGAIALAAASDLALTFWAGGSGQADVAGHLLGVLSFYLIYKALIETELRRPYHLLFRNQRRSEAMLRQERNFADCLMETAQIIVLVLDCQGRILRLNQACERLTGYALAQVQGRPYWEVFPAPDEIDKVKEAFFRLIAGDFRQAYEIDWLFRDGTRRPVAWSTAALMGENGAVESVIGTGIDLTGWRGEPGPAARGRIEEPD